MKKYWIVFGFLFLMNINTVKAQDYKTVVGVRAGLPAGLSIKHLVNGGVFGLEGIVGSDFRESFIVTGLFEYQGYLNRSLNWYAGAGASLIANKTLVGGAIDAVGGVELTFDNYPLNVAFDYKPSFKISDRSFVWYEMGLSIRYIIRY
jgi:hypothetical protein